MDNRPPEFDALLVRYLPGLTNLAARLTRYDHQKRDDLINDAVLFILANWQKFRGVGFHGWASLLMRDCARNMRKRDTKHSASSESLDTVTEWQVAVPPTQEHAVELAQVMAYVDTMPPRRALVVRMLAAGYTGADIAPILGVTRAAASESYRRSQRELAERFGAQAAA